MLRRFIRYLKLVIDARKRVVSALVYPSVLVGLSIAMLFVMAIFVMPRFTVFYDSMDMELPLLTRITLGVSVFLRDNILFILAGIIATVVVGAQVGSHADGSRSPRPLAAARSACSVRCCICSRSPSTAARSRPCSPEECRSCPRWRSPAAR